MSAALIAVPDAPPTVAEVRQWPGVWAVESLFIGWVIHPDSNHPEDAIASARKLARMTGMSVSVRAMTVAP